MIGEYRLPEIEEYLAQQRKALIITGSCEQHGRHLPYGTDLMIPEAIARAVADKAGIMIVPPIAFGLSDCHMDFPGTITLRADTYFRLMEDIILSLFTHGCTQFLIVNGHGGNTPVLNDLIQQLADRITATLVEWWDLPDNIALMKSAFGEPDYHASAAETSLLLYLAKDLVDMQSAVAHPVRTENSFPTQAEFRRWYPVGAVGPNPQLASEHVGEQLFQNTVKACLKALGNM